MYACPFLSPEQCMFTAHRNYRYQKEPRPGMRGLLWQSVDERRPPCQVYPNRSGGCVRSAPRRGGYRRNELYHLDRRDVPQVDVEYPCQDKRGNRDRSRLPPGVQHVIMYFQD